METKARFAGAVPVLYQQHMVPMIFEPYAVEMAERGARLGATQVLELAAGTGVVTRALAARLSRDAALVATDINQAMLDIAAGLQGNDPRISFLQADALALPFERDQFDLVVCQFGAMFFPDKLQAYCEARRVLRPGGTFLFSVWDRISTNAFVAVVKDVLDKRFPAEPPRFMERIPHGYHASETITASLVEAGFSKIQAQTVAKLARAGTATSAAIGYCQGTPLRDEIEAREPGGLPAVTDAVASALAQRFGGGRIEGTITAHLFEARK